MVKNKQNVACKFQRKLLDEASRLNRISKEIQTERIKAE